MGRSVVFFSKKLGWSESKIDAYEGEGTETKCTVMGPRFYDSFCGNIGVLTAILEYNKITNVEIINSADVPMNAINKKYDPLYSFCSIGFHWSIEHFLNDLEKLMAPDALGIFALPPQFKPPEELDDWKYTVLDWKAVWPKDVTLKLLLLESRVR